MKISLVGHEMFCRDFSQRRIPFEFFDNQFYSGSTIVKPPSIERSKLHVGHNDLVAIFAIEKMGINEDAIIYFYSIVNKIEKGFD